MKLVVVPVLLVVASIIGCIFASPVNDGDRVLNTPNYIIQAGYHAETHTVTTEDGYILTMHRIPYRRHEDGSDDENRPVVFLMHGLMAASNSFIFLPPEYSIAYNFADAGFDVWMGNARGNRASRSHVTMDPDVHRIDFFDFTWEEIGMYDISAMLDYILDHTGRQRLHYVGHSQGGTVFLTLTTMRPEYNAKIASAHLLAGVGYMDYFPHFFLRNLAQFTNIIWALALRLGIIEIFPPISIGGNMAADAANNTNEYRPSDYCTGDPTMKDFCDLIGISEILQYNDDTVSILNGFGGASLKQIAHYGQNIQASSFRRWDHGMAGNIAAYGSAQPPIYNMSLITADVTMHYTVSDSLLDERDVLNMVRDMPNTVARRVARDSFLHADFVFANDVRELVTEYMMEYILKVEANTDPDDGGDVDSGDGDNGDGDPDASSTAVLSFVFKLYLIMHSLYRVISL